MNVWVDPQPKAYLGASILQAYSSHHMRGTNTTPSLVGSLGWEDDSYYFWNFKTNEWCWEDPVGLPDMVPPLTQHGSQQTQRFLFSFGTRLYMEKQSWNGFLPSHTALACKLVCRFRSPFWPSHDNFDAASVLYHCGTALRHCRRQPTFCVLAPETEAHFFLYLMCFTPRSKGLSYTGLLIIVSFFIIA